MLLAGAALGHNGAGWRGSPEPRPRGLTWGSLGGPAGCRLTGGGGRAPDIRSTNDIEFIVLWYTFVVCRFGTNLLLRRSRLRAAPSQTPSLWRRWRSELFGEGFGLASVEARVADVGSCGISVLNSLMTFVVLRFGDDQYYEFELHGGGKKPTRWCTTLSVRA